MRLFSVAFFMILLFGDGMMSMASAASISSNCTLNGVPLYGKVKIVDSFPDFKIKIVSSFADLKVKQVSAFPDSCGKWQIVNSFPDFKVQFVDSFPDFTIKYVDSFPGLQAEHQE